MTNSHFNEKELSQIPALQLLTNVGYKVLSPQQALAFRGGRIANVLLGARSDEVETIN